MLSLQQLDPSTFPSCVVSHGGPQSNAMVAIAAVVRYQNERLGLSSEDPQRRRFVYYTKKLPRFLRKTPSGNLFRATSLGTEIVELSPAEYNGMFRKAALLSVSAKQLDISNECYCCTILMHFRLFW